MAFDPIAYINEPRWQQSRLGLERIRELLERLGRPQDRLKFVHVAGTNGKGSTCAYLASVLHAAGYRTGLFTSPYILTFEERIRVDGRNISLEELSAVTLAVKHHAEAMADETGDHPTEFELMTAVALEHFARTACDIVVLEVGLGGRLDSTNVIEAPEVSVIARIALDHTNLLGNTLAAIAGEKAGIIKAGVPVVSWPQEPEAMAVIERVAADCGETACACNCAASSAGDVRGEIYVPDFSHLEVHPVERCEVGVRPEEQCSRNAQSSQNVSRETFVPKNKLCEDLQHTNSADVEIESLGELHQELHHEVHRRLDCEAPVDLQNVSRETFVPVADTTLRCLTASSKSEIVSRETFVRPFVYRGVAYQTQLLGSYQPANAALALETVEVLRQRGWDISEEAACAGIAQTQWPGRFEVVEAAPDRPTIVVDGGHNPQGAQALIDSLQDVFPGQKPVFVIGVLEDKDYPAMLETVLPYGSAFVVTTPDNPRALPAAKLARAIRWTGQDLLGCSACVNPYVARDMEDALCRARELAGSQGLICVFGSLYAIAAVKRALVTA